MFSIRVSVLVVCLCYVRGQLDKHQTDMTIDQIIMMAMSGSDGHAGTPEGILNEPDKTLAELDMVLTKKQTEALYGPALFSERVKRKAAVDETVYWPNGKVPYKLAPYDFNLTEQWMIKVAMREWEKYTCVRFHEAKSSDRNYINIQNGWGGCNSLLGMAGAAQNLNLHKNGCRYKGLYLHEIGHALGVIHEHQRPIRDRYIRILYGNVAPQYKVWFNKYNPEAINNFNVDYEYSSVMHYGITSFSKEGKQTIQALQPTREKEIGKVYAKELSFTDIEIVNRMYKCVPTSEECEGKRCTGKGFLDQNCNCLCPDGSHDCTVGAQVDKSCSNKGETIDSWKCYVWARQGECERNPQYMLPNCPKACGQCGNERQHFPDLLCDNVYDDGTCENWKDKTGDCRVSETFMRKYCKRTCGYCSDLQQDQIPPLTRCANRHGNDTACDIWARYGECVVNERWMHDNCAKACFTCPVDNVATKEPATTKTPEQSTTIEPNGDCVNIYPDKDCNSWAKYDHCNINPTFMEPNCKRSCGLCRHSNTGTSAKGGNENNKVDTWSYPSKCVNWAKTGHCDKNPSFMLNNCAKSCHKYATGTTK